jgi:hypothetical protein
MNPTIKRMYSELLGGSHLVSHHIMLKPNIELKYDFVSMARRVETKTTIGYNGFKWHYNFIQNSLLMPIYTLGGGGSLVEWV